MHWETWKVAFKHKKYVAIVIEIVLREIGNLGGTNEAEQFTAG